MSKASQCDQGVWHTMIAHNQIHESKVHHKIIVRACQRSENHIISKTIWEWH
jgi:hypothetical protein